MFLKVAIDTLINTEMVEFNGFFVNLIIIYQFFTKKYCVTPVILYCVRKIKKNRE